MDVVERYRKRRRDRLVQRMRNAASPEEAKRLAVIVYLNCYRQDGGPGSGNWGHESVPGVRGGSKPGGGKHNRQGSSDKGYTSAAKEKKKANEAEKTRTSGFSHMPTKPVRPKKTDYADSDGNIDYDALEKARKAYHTERDKWTAEVNTRVNKQVPEHSMTSKEMSSWCKKNGISVYGSIDAVDGRLLTAFTNRFEQLSSDFPEGLTETYVDGATGNKETFGFEVSYTPTIDYIAKANNGMDFGGMCQDAEDVAWAELESQATGWTVNTGDGLNALFDHEYGHKVYKGLQYNGTRTYAEREAMRADLIKNVYGKDGMSEYATTNDDELFAEGFAAYYAGEKTDFAKSTGEFIARWRTK